MLLRWPTGWPTGQRIIRRTDSLARWRGGSFLSEKPEKNPRNPPRQPPRFWWRGGGQMAGWGRQDANSFCRQT